MLPTVKNIDMKYRVYYLERRDLDLGNDMYVDYRYFLEEVVASPFNTEQEAIEYCERESDKNSKFTILPVYGG